MNSQQSRERWTVCDVNVPKEEIVYCSQVFVAFVVIVVGLANLSFTESDTCLGTRLISGALGYLLPNPSLNRNESVYLTLPSNSSMNTTRRIQWLDSR